MPDPQWWEKGLPQKLTPQEIADRDRRIEEKREQSAAKQSTNPEVRPRRYGMPR